MSSVYRKLILLLFLIVGSFTLKAQVLSKIQNAFDGYSQNVFREKLFVHTDKEQYLTGELLWLKVYNTSASGNRLTDVSKTAYIELIDRDNTPVMQIMVALKAGTGNGSFYVPLTLANGTYRLRAYTNWMKNFGADVFFEKQLTIINPLNAPDKARLSKAAQDLQFFPEGGDMVEGINCNVGFKALNAAGESINIQGVVVNQKNDTVARFKSLKYGIGQFTFTPVANESYKAIAGSAKGDVIIKELPAAKKQGFTMLLTEEDNDQLKLNVGTKLNSGSVYLFVHNGQKASVAETASISGGKAVFQVSKSKLNDGISHFTVFNDAGQAVAERLYFKRPVQKLNIISSTDAGQYNQRNAVNVNVSVNNEKGEPSLADLSVAVRKLDEVQGLDQSDIVSYIWLSSELKGNVEDPGYYFLNNNNETNKALDNLLLTQGWRRFAWQEAMDNKKPLFSFLPEFNGHLIKGKVTTKNGAAAKAMNVYLGIPGKKLQFYESLSDSAGAFLFNAKELYGTNELVMQTDPNADSTAVISVESPFSEQYSGPALYETAVKPEMINALQAHSFGMQVQNTYSADKFKRFYALSTDSSKFYGKPFKAYKLEDYTRFNTMEEVLREYVTEVFVSKSEGNYHVKLLSNSNTLDGDPLVLVDGVPYFNINKMFEIDPHKIKNLDVVPEVYFYGSSLFEGILSFSSFKNNLADIKIDPNAVVLDYEGMQQQREFYVPSYATPEQAASRIPDFRNVLYWSPSVNLDAKGRGKFDFYTSDLPGKYIGVINGISKDGIPGNVTFTFEVKAQ